MPSRQSHALGRSLPRLDGLPKVTGLCRYTGDLVRPGMLHARLVLSPHAHARLLHVDAREALALPGVVAVLTARDLPLAHPDAAERTGAPLARDRVRFAGQPVAVVVAETAALAADACARVRVEYEPLAAVTDPAVAMGPGAPAVAAAGAEGPDVSLAAHGAGRSGRRAGRRSSPNVASTARYVRGHIRRGLDEAEVVVHGYTVSRAVYQGYLEPQAAVAEADALGRVTVWTSTQALFQVRTEVARALGLAESQVRVVAMPVGGGFGGKYGLLEPLTAAVAVRLRRPVALVLTRLEDFLATNPAPGASIELTLGARRDGRLTALRARVIFDTGAYPAAPLTLACLLLGASYRIPHLDIQGWEVLTHKPGAGAYRAPGAVQATVAIESAMDDLARRLAVDPLALRLRNAVDAGDPMVDGTPWPRIGLRTCLERLAEVRRRWGARPRPCGRVRRGVGLAVGGWLGGVEPASALCRLEGDGRLSVVVGTVDLSGTNTVLAQIVAEVFGVPVDHVSVINADSDSAPWVGSTGGSKITYTVGAAVKAAAEDARRQILAVAAAELEAAVDDLELVGDRVRVRGVPGRALSLARIAELSTAWEARHPPVLGRGTSALTAPAPAFAVHLSEVDVDLETGQVAPRRHLVVQDVGRALNPAAIAGQIAGGVAQGVGWALQERLVWDLDGHLRTASFLEYALPGVTQVPSVEAVLVEVPSEHGPFGARGVGETPVVAAAAAILNAVTDATGQRVAELPVSPEALWAASRTSP
jgi:CO/xanthine dehydrogenase Mo-binding subunit